MTFPVIDSLAQLGTVATPRWVVELTLDLCGYTDSINLSGLTVSVPSAGSGGLVVPVVRRLLASAPAAPRWPELAGCLRAWEVPDHQLAELFPRCTELLVEAGCPGDTAAEVARAWLGGEHPDSCAGTPERADVVIGRPPDVGWIERSLDLLTAGGSLGFVGPRHWQQDEAGRRLRAKIATRGFAVDAIIALSDAESPRQGSDHSTAITVIRRGQQEEVVVAYAAPEFDPSDTEALLDWIDFGTQRLTTPTLSADRLDRWPHTSAPWPLSVP